MSISFIRNIANQQRQKADNTIKNGVLFGNRYKVAEAMYDEAAKNYKDIREWENAGYCLEQRAFCFIQLKNMNKSASLYVEAANEYLRDDIRDVEKAANCQNKAVRIYCENGKFLMAARLENKIGDAFEKEGNLLEAIKHYEKASDYYFGENSGTNGIQCLVKKAECHVKLKMFKEGAEVFEKIMQAEDFDKSLIKFHIDDYIFYTICCKFAAIKKEEHELEVPYLQTKLDDYIREESRSFEDTREDMLLKALFKSYEEQDPDIFEEEREEYERVKKLDEFKEELLYGVEEKLDEIIHYIHTNVDIQ